MSNQIFKEHKIYNDVIEQTQKGTGDITIYLEWFLECFEWALLSSRQNLEIILDKSRFWDGHNSKIINERQRLVINFFYDNYNQTGYLRTSVYSKLAKCSADTALRDLQDLVCKNMLKIEGSGKKTSYLVVSPAGLRIPAIEADYYTYTQQ